MSEYQKQGYKNRDEYLRMLARDYGVKVGVVKRFASFLGSGEDFDGLVSMIEEYVDCYGGE